MTPEEIQERLQDLSSLSGDDLAALENELVSGIQAHADTDTDESLDAMVALDSALSKVRTEATTRATASEQRATRREEILARTRPAEVEEVAEEPESAEEVAEVEQPVAEDPQPQVTVEQPVEEPVAVAAALKSAPRPTPGSLAKVKTSQVRVSSPRSSFDGQILTMNKTRHGGQGANLSTIDEVGEAFIDVASTMTRRGGIPGYTPIARFQVDYPADHILSGSEPDVWSQIAKVINPTMSMNMNALDALTAAGGLCAPTQAYYEVAGISTVSRPIRDSLPGFAGANRGGIRFVPPPILSDVTGPGVGSGGAVDIITEAEDSANATKPCFVVTCEDVTEVLTQAIPLCMQVGNFLQLTYPEHWRAFWNLGLSRHARTAENELWDRMCTLSTAVTAGVEILGAMREIFPNLDRAAAAYKSRHRMSLEAPLHIWLPSWIRDALRVDLTRQAPGDDAIARADTIINAAFAQRNFNVTYSPDAGGQIFGNQAAGAMNPWPDTVEVLMAHEGAFLFLDTGRLDFGMEIRDSTLNAANNVRAMFETFENVAFVGIEALCITMDYCPNGEAAALADASAYCTSGS